MVEWDPSEFLDVMDRRGSLLRKLADGPKTKPELEAAMSVSRSTVDRGVRELEGLDLIERTAEGYRQTLAGELALEEYDEFVDQLSGVSRGATLLAKLDGDADIDPVMLSGARVVEGDRASPHRPAGALYDVVESATEVRGFTPSVHPEQVRTYSRRIKSGDLSVDLVVTDGVLERLASRYAEEFEAALETGRARVWRTAEEFPYSLTLATTPSGRVAGLTVYDERGILGCILNDGDAAVEWAAERFERAREAADRVT